VTQLPEEVRRRVVGVVTLIRYYKWSLTLQERAAPFMKAKERGEQLSEEDAIRSVGLLSYWFASLYVVVEGWQRLRLRDQLIDTLLLESENLSLLRGFRNGVFHFQASYTDKRFAEFFGKGRYTDPVPRSRCFAIHSLRLRGQHLCLQNPLRATLFRRNGHRLGTGRGVERWANYNGQRGNRTPDTRIFFRASAADPLRIAENG
jgi:hypothetical protein